MFQAVKKIKLKEERSEEAKKIESKYSPILSRILAARGFTLGEELENFINPTLRSGLKRPEYLKNLKAAALLLKQALEDDLTIAVCCDFDVDGLSGGSLLYQFLTDIGAKSQVFVPDRFTEGYGLNKRLIDEAIKAGCKFLIAIDFGTSNIEALQYAKEKGIVTLVIDHHHVSETLPPTDCFVNPEQPECDFISEKLCSAGLVWYFITVLRETLPQAKDIDVREYLDFACLGTICDMVPLLRSNRVIAKKGLEKIGEKKRIGIKALLEASGVKKKVTCTDVSFGIGPRINAAGRMASGDLVIELLTTNDSKKADALAHKLDRLNAERQDLEKKIKAEAKRRIEKMVKLPSGIVISDKEFHTGVVGIVAQRLVEEYYRPSAVIGMDKNGVYKGSCRGIKGFNVVEALENISQYLLGFGGHTGAGGFSLTENNISAFSVAFNDEAERQLSQVEVVPYVEADTVVELSDIDAKLIDDLGLFAPYGMGNPAPVLLIRSLRVLEVNVLRSTHLKALVSDGKRTLPLLLWNQTSHPAIQRGAVIDLACRPQMNTFNGLLEVQLILQAAEIIG